MKLTDILNLEVISCEFCKSCFQSLAQLLVHLNIHTELRSLLSYGIIIDDTKPIFEYDILNDLDYNRFECIFCNKKLSKLTFIIHMEAHVRISKSDELFLHKMYYVGTSASISELILGKNMKGEVIALAITFSGKFTFYEFTPLRRKLYGQGGFIASMQEAYGSGMSGQSVIRAGSSGQIIRAGSSGQIIRAGSSGQMIRAGSSGQMIRAGSSDQMIRAGSSDQIIRAGSSGQMIRAGPSDQIIRAGSSGQIIRAGSSGNSVARAEINSQETVRAGLNDQLVTRAGSGSVGQVNGVGSVGQVSGSGSVGQVNGVRSFSSGSKNIVKIDHQVNGSGPINARIGETESFGPSYGANLVVEGSYEIGSIDHGSNEFGSTESESSEAGSNSQDVFRAESISPKSDRASSIFQESSGYESNSPGSDNAISVHQKKWN